MHDGPDPAALGAYLDSLQYQRMLSPHTISNYARDLRQLQALAQAIAVPLAAVTHLQVRKFASQLHARGLNARSIARTLSCWRGFYGWLAQQDGLLSNPVDGIKAPRKSQPLPKALAMEDAVHLVSHSAPGKDPETAMQRCNRAMFELLYSSGLRVSELAGLDVRHHPGALGWIALDTQEVTVTGKGNKMRSVPVGQHAMAALHAWLAVRAELSATDPHALFLSARGTRMSPRVLQLRLKAHGGELGMAVHPHVLRHSFASHVLQGSGDLRAVQEMLGHASISATQVYTALDFQRLAQVYDAAHPRARKTST